MNTFPKRRNIGERGLKTDGGDEQITKNPNTKEKVNGRDLYFGAAYKNEFMQPMPFFWTSDGNSVNTLIGHYRGGVAFLIAGGPSFKDLDKTRLARCWSLGLNNSPKTFRPDAWISVDDPSRFLRSVWLDPKIMKFQAASMAGKRLWDTQNNQPLGLVPRDCPNVYYFKRNSKFHEKRWLQEDSLNWGNAEDFGGGRTVMLPAIKVMYLLGFRTIYLVGVDLDMSATRTYHFDEKRDKGAVKCNNNTYKRMNQEYFPKLRPEFEKAGLDVFNCNSDSKLTAFDYVPYEEALDHALYYPGDMENESTFGLYDKPEKKFKEYEERVAAEKAQKDTKEEQEECQQVVN